VHGWSEAEYILWIQKHQNEQEQWALLESSINDQVGKDGGEERHLDLIKKVLEQAKEGDQPT
jgi:hypothetical protein